MKTTEQIIHENALYGVQESNPLTSGDYHEIERDIVYFDELKKSDKIVLNRLRLVTDAGFPRYDVSYIYVTVNGKKSELCDFPSQLPKRGYKKYLVDVCKEQGIFIKDLCNDGKISILR